MNNETRVAILTRSFELVEDILCKCLKPTEEETRSAIKAEFLERYEKVGNDDNEKIALMDAYKKIEVMDYDELVEIVDLLGGVEYLDEEKSLGEKFFFTNCGEKFVLYDDKGEPVRYMMKLRFDHKDRHFCMAVNFDELEKDDCCPPCDFLEFTFGEHPEDDKLIEVTDEDLIQELSDVVADIYDKINDDDDED